MQIRTDWILHAKGGTIVLAVTIAIIVFGRLLGLSWPTIALFIAGLVAGASVEGTQSADNRLAKSKGLLPTHEVALGDLIASAVPCWLAAAAIELALRFYPLAVPPWMA